MDDYVKAVDDISFKILPGETFALVGESGCGKTTTAKAIIRLIPMTSGHIYFNGIDLIKLSRKCITAPAAEYSRLFFKILIRH